MLRRLPLIPTLVVLAAVAVMIRLGFWQIDRMHEKNAMLASYALGHQSKETIDWSGNAEIAQKLLYRRVRVNCVAVLADHPVAGRNRKNESGWAQPVSCNTAEGASLRVILGWTREPYFRPVNETTPDDRLLNIWKGGIVIGVLAPGPRLVADPPLGGLQANALPDPNDIPNNHWSYAIQWFLFALTALVIYGLAVRKRLAVRDTEG